MAAKQKTITCNDRTKVQVTPGRMAGTDNDRKYKNMLKHSKTKHKRYINKENECMAYIEVNIIKNMYSVMTEQGGVRLGLTMLLLIAFACVNLTSAQDITSTYTTPTDSVPYGVVINQDGQIHTEEQTLSESERESRYDDLYLIQSVDLYNQPNNHEKFLGKNKLDYAYSGDANNDEVLDMQDVEAIRNGISNYRTDVNFDGTTNSTDANLLEDHITNGTPLPSQAFLNPNATRAEKEDLGLNINVNNWNNIKYIAEELHGDCEHFTNYIVGITRGIENFQDLPLMSDFENQNAHYNVPFVRIDTYKKKNNSGGPHAINGFYSGKVNNTSMLNILDFKNNYSKVEPTFKKLIEIGDRSLNSYANVIVLLPIERNGEIVFDKPKINFNFVDDKVEVKRINNNYMLTNPKAIMTNFEGNASDTLNYVTDLEVENRSRPSITTNVDLDSEINTVADPGAKIKNILRRTTLMGDKIPLSDDPELADIYYKQNIETIVGYIQHVVHSLGENSNLLKEDIFNQTIVVDDLEAPKVEGFTGEVTSNYVKGKNWQSEVEKSLEGKVTDNSNLDVQKDFTSNSTQKMDGTVDQVNYDIVTDIELTDKRDNTKKLTHTRHIRDQEKPIATGFEGEVSYEYAPDLDIEEEIDRTKQDVEVTDNSALPVEKTYTTTSTQKMDGSINQVNYDVEAKLALKDIAGNMEHYTKLFKVRDTEKPTATGFEGEEEFEYSTDLNLEERLNQIKQGVVVNDNSTLPVEQNYSLESNQQMDGSINQVNYDVEAKLALKDIAGNMEHYTKLFKVRDTEPPKVYLPEDSVYQIEKGENPLEAIVMDSITDNSNLPVETNMTSQIVDENNNYRTHEVTIESQDIAGNTSQKTQTVKEDLKTGIEELTRENKSLDIDLYPNPVRNNATIRLSSNKEIENGMVVIRDVLGRVVDKIEIDRVEPNRETEIPYTGFGNLNTGIYFISMHGRDRTAHTHVVHLN